MKNKNISLILIIIVCIFLFIISLLIGSFDLSIEDIINILLGKNDSSIQRNVFYNLRIPRAVMGIYAGVALGFAGSIYQVLFCNPLASPDLTGVASGASLGAALAIVIGTGGKQLSTYILAGIIISSLADAGIMMLKYMADPLGELASIEFWTMGSLASITLDKMILSLLLGIIPFVLLCLAHQRIIILSLGDENARYLGLNARGQRFIILLLTTWLIASVIAITGVISFVGLIAPHITYLFLKKRTGCFYIVSGLIGAIIILVADMLARSLVFGAELPLSVLTILFSSPMLLFWMYRQRGSIK